jgi:tRNA 2-thiouridine synthesizing protein B
MLHTVNKSPYSSNSLELCMAYIQSGDVVLLIEDGVYAAMKGGASEALVSGSSAKVYALGPDLKARGIAGEKLIDGIEVVGFDGFVSLAADNDKVQSWL